MTAGYDNTRDRVTPGHNGEKSLRIIEKAIELFNRVGYERVKVSDITDALQIGKGTLYLYFKNKKELLLECFRQLHVVISLLEASAEVQNASGFFERLRPRFAGAHKQYIRIAGTLNLIRLSSESEDADIRRSAKEAYRTLIDPLERDLETAIRQGVARPIDAELAACGLVGFAETIITQAAQHERYSADEIDDMIIDFAERAFRVPPKRSNDYTPTADCRRLPAKITDRNGVSSNVDELRFDGGEKLRGILGQAAIELAPDRVNSIAIRESGGVWLAEVVTCDGAKASLQIQPNVIISGQSALGTLRIALSDISTLVFSNPQH